MLHLALPGAGDAPLAVETTLIPPSLAVVLPLLLLALVYTVVVLCLVLKLIAKAESKPKAQEKAKDAQLNNKYQTADVRMHLDLYLYCSVGVSIRVFL